MLAVCGRRALSCKLSAMKPDTRHLLLLCVLVAGCGGGSSGVDSGLPAGKSGADLTPPEQNKVCEATIGYLDRQLGDERKAAYCRTDAIATALASSGDAASCETQYQACLAAPEEDDPQPCSFGPDDWNVCDAPVSEIEACYTDYVDASVDLYLDLTCADVADYREHWPGDDYVPGPACEQAETRCPGVLPL